MISSDRLLNALTAFNLQDLNSVVLREISAEGRQHMPPFPPSLNALLFGSNATLAGAIAAVYPAEHRLRALLPDGQVVELSVAELAGLKDVEALYLPAIDASYAFETFQEIIARLRAPDGCPWDREQTHLSLRKYLLEETYEALDALDSGDMRGFAEELGDLLLQILLHAQIGLEAGEFNMADVVRGISNKIVFRHPHVFGETEVNGVKNVLQNWDKLKAEERKANGKQEKGMLDGVPSALPALTQAQELQDRAARVGFDWPSIEPVLAKVEEELEEMKTAPDPEHRAEELGDLLFAVVNVIRWYGVDSESALRETNRKFRRRFGYIEQQARKHERKLTDMTLDEMDVWWNEAKHLPQTDVKQ